MSRISSTRRRQLTFLAFCALIITMAALLSVFTPAQTQKGKKKPTLDEAVTREGKNLIRAKPGYEIIKDSRSTVVVRRKGAGVIAGRFNCAVCPGGSCFTVTYSDGSATCAAEIYCHAGSCFISPF